MRIHSVRLTLALVLLAAATGCQSLGDAGDLTSDSLLRAAEGSPDAVTLDIYWARTSLDDQTLADALWQSVQEDRVPVEVRCALADFGMRVGVIGGTPSEEIVRLLNPDGADVTAEPDPTDLLSLNPPKVTRRLKQLPPGQRLELQADEAVESFSLLRGSGEALVGETFSQAQGIYAVEVGRPIGGQVQIKLLPELHHGQPRMKYTTAGPGMVVQKLGRDVEPFAELATKVELSPGEMLVVTSLPGASHRLGGLFHHTSVAEGVQQKYLLLRLSQVPEAAVLATSDQGAWPWQ